MSIARLHSPRFDADEGCGSAFGIENDIDAIGSFGIHAPADRLSIVCEDFDHGVVVEYSKVQWLVVPEFERGFL